jgi:hypothetical protein
MNEHFDADLKSASSIRGAFETIYIYSTVILCRQDRSTKAIQEVLRIEERGLLNAEHWRFSIQNT